MNPPPPPPAAPVEKQCHISRDGTVLGIWPISAIRSMLVSGELKPSDHYWHEGADGWERIVPEPPIAATPFPYIGDELPFYFIRAELLYGPRTAAEIDTLHSQGWLSDDALITFCGAEQWWTLKEFMELDDEAPVTEAEKFDWVKHGARAYIGDPVSGAKIGMHVAKRAMAWFAALPSSPPDTPKGDA